ncbi:MAG: adenylate/guanylate cyclase domain-containing protein [Thermoleophilia bacterium]|nr:adenylate/guanylate cyclase domain-containing protein [Thermoleophilia bacterium]
MTLTGRQHLMYVLAALLAAAGCVVVVLTVPAAMEQLADRTVAAISVMLLLSAFACARFPLRYGIGETIVTLDSIPLVLAVVLIDPGTAATIALLTTLGAMVGQPAPIGGWRGRFWYVATPLNSALVVGGAGLLVDHYRGSTAITFEQVLFVPAFVVSLLMEFAFIATVLVEFEAVEPAGALLWLRHSVVPSAANVLLPSVAVAVSTPYLGEPWQFIVLLPILLVGMYGALWVANSQQIQKRRGDRLKDTFSRYVPEGIVDDNIESMHEIELGGEQADLSVLFCDIRGFTSWSEDKGATEVITELNVLLTELSASVMSTGGTLDKFTGDGLMAFWGAPVVMEDHAERASRAALDMLLRLEQVNDRRKQDGQEPFAIGVAVHSGTAVVGNVGHERRLDYTAIGDTVNTTARLEASTKELGAVLLLSRSTVDLLGDELRARAMRIGDVTMKGKARPVEAWALQPLRPDLDGVDDEFAA